MSLSSMKNLLHSSLVVASIVAAQPVNAESRLETAAGTDAVLERADRYLDDLLYPEEAYAEKRSRRDDLGDQGRRRVKASKPQRSAARNAFSNGSNY